MFVPVLSKDGEQLMPTKPNKAGMLVKKGLATPFWRNGIYCIRLNYEPKTRHKQEIVAGVDPGSQKEGFTVKSTAHTYLNVQAEAKMDVGKKIERRRNSRRGRRTRKKPYRKNRTNRLANKERIPAGTRARWDWKLRILEWLSQMFPVTHVCVEDIKAGSRQGQRRWNASFNPLQVGKDWFYRQVSERWALLTLQGHETARLRESLGLKKSSQKMAESFDAHCVDSWCLAYHTVGGDIDVDNTAVFCIYPMNHKRRCLHRELPQKGGVRPRYGGTMSMGWKKQTLVKHTQQGLCLVGGHQKGRLALHDVETGKRLTLSAKPDECKRLKRVQFRFKQIGSVSIRQDFVQLTLF